jgi:hypothetical protein
MIEVVETAVEQVRVRVLPDGRMTPPNAAAYTGYSEKTLAQWRYLGIGPRWVKNGGRVFYYRADLDAHAAEAKASRPAAPAAA